MNFRIGLCLVVAAAMAVCVAEAGVRDLRNKYRNLIGSESGGSAAAAAASASSAGVSSSVSGSSPTGGYHYQGNHQPAPQYIPHSHHHQPHYYSQEPPVAPAHFARPPVYRAPPQQHQVPRQPRAYYGDGGLIDESVPQFVYGQQPVYDQQQQYQYAPRHHRHNHNHNHRRHYPEPQHYASGTRGPGAYQAAGVGGPSVAASAATVGGGHHGASAGGSAAAAAATSASSGAMNSNGLYFAPDKNHHTVDQEQLHQQYYEPETVNHFEAQSGTYGDGAGGNFEQGSYARDTESIEKHEDGREDGDHYYNAHAYGKSGDVNNYMAYNNKDEDLIHTPNLFRKKKSKTNFVSNFNKQHRETGSGVVAHDKHSAMYNKDTKKLKENVDQRFTKGADGLLQTKNFNSHTDIDDEDEMAMDSRGLGNFVGVDGVAHGARRQTEIPSSTAAVSAAAAAAGAGASAASAATQAGR